MAARPTKTPEPEPAAAYSWAGWRRFYWEENERTFEIIVNKTELVTRLRRADGTMKEKRETWDRAADAFEKAERLIATKLKIGFVEYDAPADTEAAG